MSVLNTFDRQVTKHWIGLAMELGGQPLGVGHHVALGGVVAAAEPLAVVQHVRAAVVEEHHLARLGLPGDAGVITAREAAANHGKR